MQANNVLLTLTVTRQDALDTAKGVLLGLAIGVGFWVFIAGAFLIF